jgi:hypothetical protein
LKNILALALLMVAACHASTTTIYSGAGVGYNSLGPNVVVTPDPVYGVFEPNASFISSENTGLNGLVIPNSWAFPWNTFYQPFSTSSAATVTIEAEGDDFITEKLDGVTILAYKYSPDFYQPITITEVVAAGNHTLEFALYQTDGAETELKYVVSVTPSTPEPATIFMLSGGCGLLYLVRRTTRK